MNADTQGYRRPISVSHDTLSTGQPKHLYHHIILLADGQSVRLACPNVSAAANISLRGSRAPCSFYLYRNKPYAAGVNLMTL